MCTKAPCVNCLFSVWLQDCQVIQDSMAFLVLLVTRVLQDTQDHQASQELVAMVQVMCPVYLVFVYRFPDGFYFTAYY